MKRTRLIVLVATSVLLASCNPGSGRPSHVAGGAIGTEATTSSTTTTFTGTTPPSAAASADEGRPADCPSPAPPHAIDDAARRNSLRMLSAEKGFAVNNTSVLVTDDGRTWSLRYSGPDPMLSIDAVDADHAWAVGQRIALATSDGGRSWQPIGEPEEGMLRAVDFIDAHTGWAVTGRHVVRTLDGGRTWQNVDPPCGGEAVCFTGRDDGWAAIGRHVYRTTDGERWEPAFTAPADDITHPFNRGSIHAGQLQCARPGVAWVTFIGSASGGHVAYAAYRGTAAGQWTPVMKEAVTGPRTVRAPAGGTWPGPMSALGTGSALYVAFTPLGTPAAELDLRTATDGGRRLGPGRPIHGLFSTTALSFVSPEVGWVLGTKASAPVDAILATTDAGRTWHEQYTYTVPAPAG